MSEFENRYEKFKSNIDQINKDFFKKHSKIDSRIKEIWTSIEDWDKSIQNNEPKFKNIHLKFNEMVDRCKILQNWVLENTSNLSQAEKRLTTKIDSNFLTINTQIENIYSQ